MLLFDFDYDPTIYKGTANKKSWSLKFLSFPYKLWKLEVANSTQDK